MGQKVNPLGFRLGVSQKHISHWFIDNNHYSQLVVEDQFIRNFLEKKFTGIASINIKRDLNKIEIEIFSTNTRDLLTEGIKSTMKGDAKRSFATPSSHGDLASSRGSSSSGRGEARSVSHGSSNVQTGSGTGGSHNLCDQLLKELTMYRNTQSSKETFQNKKKRAFLLNQSGTFTEDKSSLEQNAGTPSDLTTFSPKIELNTTKKQVEIALLLTKVENPNKSAACLAEFIVEQLEKRVPFRRVLKRSIQKAEEASVEGVKVQISGRLNGAEIARSERIHKGQVPLHTLRAKIEYNSRTAKTIYGLLGVKVWVFNGFADSNEVKFLNLNQVYTEDGSQETAYFSGATKT